MKRLSGGDGADTPGIQVVADGAHVIAREDWLRALSSKVIVAVATWLAPLPVGADTLHLKFAFPNRDTDKIWTATLKPFIDSVNAAGKGVLQIDAFPNGGLSRGLTRQPRVVLDGVADIAYVVPSLTPGRFPDNEVMELPGLFRDIRESTLVHMALIDSGVSKSYSEYYVVAALGGIPAGIHTRTPLQGLNDIVGKKIRVAGTLQAKAMIEMGATPVLLGLPDVSDAVLRGAIDGIAIQPVPLDDSGMSRILNYHYFVGAGITPLMVIMNRRTFERLPAAARGLISKFRGELVTRYISKYGEAGDKILQELAADPAHKLIQPTVEEQVRLQEVYKKVSDSWVNQDPTRPRLLEAVQRELAVIRGKKP
jgi:TRAP-type C4-dicarboxylate transport system substrate-binding protein